MKTFVFGGDKFGWALDEDLRHTKNAISKFAKISEIEDADIIHLCNWYHAFELPSEILKHKKVICNITGEPSRLFSAPRFFRMYEIVDKWIVHSEQASKQAQNTIGATSYVPYGIDFDIFKKLTDGQEKLRKAYNLPINSYVISNFQRDTQGGELNEPKLVKGPDILLEIALMLKKRNVENVHFLLAGPRRHWIRKQFDTYGISYTFVGDLKNQDDLDENTLDRKTLNELYNASDLHIVTSRSEGGPHAILEAVASGCKILSRPVGVAEDILQKENLYNLPFEAVDAIQSDMKDQVLEGTITKLSNRVYENHSAEKLTACYRDAYEELIQEGERKKTVTGEWPGDNLGPSMKSRFHRLILAKISRGPRLVIWHKFKKPPWGGGNQFLLALRNALRNRGVRVLSNVWLKKNVVNIFNAITFDIEKFEKRAHSLQGRVIHRIDGPYSNIRGVEEGLDGKLAKFNADYADVSIIQSMWCAAALHENGFRFKNVVTIPNVPNPNIFYPPKKQRDIRNRKIKLVASSWSQNPRKGGAIYKWLEENLDKERFEFTFVGNCSEELTIAKKIDAVPSEKLAKILREADIFITASQNDPCSNALIEAQSCGLPAVFLNDGGHPELVKQGGMPFEDEPSLMVALETVVEHYDMFSRLVTPPDYEEVMSSYYSLVKD